MSPRSHLEGERLSHLYRERFADEDLAFKERAWTILCERVFQPLIGPGDTVLDLGAGHCEFINAIRCQEKIAVDLNPETAKHARGAKVFVTASTDLSAIEDNTIDVVFSSNFLEHLPTKGDVLQTMDEVKRVTRPQGLFIVMMPNIRYLGGRYWDYFDHHTPLTHFSLVEAMDLSGFKATRVVPRFLPYTVKQRSLPRSTALLSAYLRLRFLWPIFGRQMLVVAENT